MRPTIMTAPSGLLLALVALTAVAGCTATGGRGATMADCVKAFHHPSGDTSRCVRDPVESPSPGPTAPPGAFAGRSNVPAELRLACGHPHARLAVRTVPFSIPTARCDLTGVELDYDGMSVNVPTDGDATQIAHADGPAGSTTTTVTASQRGGEIGFTVSITHG